MLLAFFILLLFSFSYLIFSYANFQLSPYFIIFYLVLENRKENNDMSIEARQYFWIYVYMPFLNLDPPPRKKNKIPKSPTNQFDSVV